MTRAPRAPRIKFCGITRLDDARLAVEAGAWAVGVILWPGSKRACDPPEAELIARTLRRQVEVCGVFVNATLDEVAQAADTIGLTMVQLHGDEGPAFCAEVARRTGAKVIKAARVHDQGDITALAPFHTDFHLLDAHVPGEVGGTGRTFDHGLVAKRRSRVPLILSGGLNAENVGAAIAVTQPFAVDVASGVESSPGIKDPERITAFAAAVAATAPHDDEHQAVAS
ncbi:phosphoribosylanthranilate isomerase [Paraconexibacter sp.]|uniref:phosphoribosylanthranilate isomerase n=1 Tax=Paraconexibacter sp. TaxID=2949640 RepID=UPI0035627DEB